MLPFSTEDFNKLLQIMAVLEMTMHHLKVFVEINGQSLTLNVHKHSYRNIVSSKGVA